MQRILLLVATNVAVLVVLTLVMRVFGLENYVNAQGGLNLTSLLIMSAVIGFSGSLISLFLSKTMAKRGTGAHVIENPRNAEETWLVNTVERFARESNIGMPEVAVYDAPEPNAFATGARRDSALVAVSTGLLRNMQRNEVEAVLAHEVAHVANGDMITMTLIQGVLNTFVIFLSRIVGFVVDRVVFKNDRGHGPGFWITSIVAQVVLGVLASIIVMWFSRQREFRADEGGARLAGRANMTAALQRLKQGQQQAPMLPDQLQAFGISGGVGQGLRRLMMSHPPLDERIAALNKLT